MNTLLKNYQIVLDSIEDGVFTVNKDWEIMSFNRAAEQITGIPRKKATGVHCREVFRSTLCKNGCILRKTMTTGDPLSNVLVNICPHKKRQIHISVNTAILRDSNDKVIGGVEVFRDLSKIIELKQHCQKLGTFENIVSKNEKIQKYFAILPQVAACDSTVLLQGATGTGKELFARAIHNAGPRKNKPFIAVNCSALPDTLIESELFGYKAGAFTDAKKDKPGRFALAENGTIFLDEIGDITPAIQVRLLRVLQEKQYDPLGGDKTEKTNARVIVATNKNLEQQVVEGAFREDLFYRINIMKFSLPPLKERKEDIPYLVEHFINQFNFLNGKSILGISQECMAFFMSYDWPGNIRELENAIEHSFVLCQGELILPEHLPERILPVRERLTFSSNLTLQDIERAAIIQALTRNTWKKVVTAKELGIDKNTLRRKIARLGITR
ncbi:sigma 54-interacting transcriptional regulator [bacterium]|nr:sigma 54-interacting transcriptional regulator [bacterium]